MGITIYDLAREAGVGIGTVSRCLNNHPSVAPATRARVLAVARRLSYQPHASAQRLASRKTNTISTIIPYFTNYFFMQVLQGVQDKASELGFDLILYGVNDTAQAEYYLKRSLARGHVDGVMFFSMRFPDALVPRFEQIRMPVVLVDARHPRFDSIDVENREGALRAVRHLLGLGHRAIAMINASLETRPAKDRLEGYRAALEEAGAGFTMDRVFVSGIGKQDGFNKESGRASMLELLDRRRRGDPISAVFVSSDVQAMGVLEAAAERGVRIPDDIALVSYDDIELAQHLELSTMRQPMHAMGMLALEKIIARLRSPEAPPTLETFTPELVVRSSCGARGIGSPARQARTVLTAAS